MLPQQTDNQSLFSLIGRGLLAIGIGGGLGLLLVWLDNPVVAVVGFIGVLAGIVMALEVDLGLLALGFMAFTRFSDIMVQDHGFPSIAKPFILLLAVGIVIRWLLYNRPPRGWDHALLLVGAYGVVIFLSLIYARDYVRSYDAASDFLKDGIIAIMIVMILQNEKVFRNFAWALVVAGIFMGTISVFQYFTGSFSNTFWGFGNTSLSNIVGNSQSYRISGPFSDPNFYAQLIVVLVPLSLDRLMSARSNFARLIAAWALVVCSLTVIITFSRGGFLSLVVVLGLYAVWKGLSLGNWILISALIMIVVLLLPAQYTERLGTLTSFLPGSQSSQNDVSLAGRISENIIGVQMFMDHPILGVGIKNYPVYYIDYSRNLGLDQRSEERSPHSLFLEVAAEQGIVGILVFSVLLYNVFNGLFFAKKTFNQLQSYEMERLTMAVMIGFIGYLTSSLFLHGAYPRPFWVMVGLSLAFYAYAKSLVQQNND